MINSASERVSAVLLAECCQPSDCGDAGMSIRVEDLFSSCIFGDLRSKTCGQSYFYFSFFARGICSTPHISTANAQNNASPLRLPSIVMRRASGAAAGWSRFTMKRRESGMRLKFVREPQPSCLPQTWKRLCDGPHAQLHSCSAAVRSNFDNAFDFVNQRSIFHRPSGLHHKAPADVKSHPDMFGRLHWMQTALCGGHQPPMIYFSQVTYCLEDK